MPPARDDPGIGDDVSLLRVLYPKWTTVKGGRERPTSDSLLDSNFENSCFVDGEIEINELQGLFPGLKIARIPAAVVRREGFLVERRPVEAPPGCTVPDSHVIVGPAAALERGDYERAARNIVKDRSVTLIYPQPNPAA